MFSFNEAGLGSLCESKDNTLRSRHSSVSTGEGTRTGRAQRAHGRRDRLEGLPERKRRHLVQPAAHPGGLLRHCGRDPARPHGAPLPAGRTGILRPRPHHHLPLLRRLEPIDYKIEVLGKKLSAKEWWFSCNIKLAVFACRFLYRSMYKTSFLVIEGVKWSACPPQTLDC